MDHTLLWCAIWMFFSSGCFVGYGESIWVVLYASVYSYYTLLWCAIWIIHYCGVQYGSYTTVVDHTLLWCVIWIIHYYSVEYGCFSVVYVL